ncbi:MAG: alpha/beta hydrolase [Ruminococcus sp.]
MVSFRGRIFRWVFRKTMNMNPKTTADTVSRLRKVSERAINDDVPEGYELSKETTENGIKFDRVTKTGADRTGRVIYYLHGGAYVAGLLSSYRTLAAGFFEASSGCEMILLDYDLAPENKYPTQLNQAIDVWNHLVEKEGYLPENIIVAGDSAGANLTMALFFKLRECGRKLPKAGICISLWGDMTCSGESYNKNYPVDVLFGEKRKAATKEDIDLLLSSPVYGFIGGEDRKNPYISPVFGEFGGFPPMFFTVGGDEVLLSDTLTVCEKLQNAGIYAECEVKEGMFHTYTVFHRIVPEAKDSYKKLLKFVKRVYAGEIN